MTATEHPAAYRVPDADPVTGELIPAPLALLTAAPVRDAVALQRQYHELVAGLLDDSDYQVIDRKRFPKKSAWRKLATAFNVSVQLIDRHEDHDELGRIVRAEVVTRATAPNGRSMDGLGICDRSERRGMSEHDLVATAMTRATNRACSDLFGMGEVSAEEVNGGGPWTSGHDAGPRAEPVTDALVAGARALQLRISQLDDEKVTEFDRLARERNLPLSPPTRVGLKAAAKLLDEIESQ